MPRKAKAAGYTPIKGEDTLGVVEGENPRHRAGSTHRVKKTVAGVLGEYSLLTARWVM